EATLVMDGNRPKLVKRGYTPMAVTADGAAALVTRTGDGGTLGLYRLDLKSRRLTRVGRSSLSPQAIGFGSDGATAANDGTAAWEITLSSGKAKRIATTPNSFVGSPIFLPNGRWLF